MNAHILLQQLRALSDEAAIPKRATAGQAPAWFMEAGHVAFVCPRGHAGWMDNHKVAADGKVTPSVVCAVQDCGFHQYVTLLDWTPIPATITTPGAPAPQATGRFSGAPAGAPEKAAKTVEAAKPAATGKAADAGKAVEIRPPGAALVKLVVTGLPAAKSAPAGTPAPRPAQKTGAVSIPASKIVTLNPARHRKPAGM